MQNEPCETRAVLGAVLAVAALIASTSAVAAEIGTAPGIDGDADPRRSVGTPEDPLPTSTQSVLLGDSRRHELDTAARTDTSTQPLDDLNHFDFQTWTIADGLPENSVTSIVQTRDGYLWIGTFGGLARFDGVRFTVFDMANTEALGTNRILSLLEARNGDLWIGTEDGGVVRLREGVFAAYRAQENAPCGKIFSIVEDQEGAIWFGGANLVRYADETFQHVSFAEGMIDTRIVRSLHIDSDNNLWTATGAGLGRFRAGQWQLFTGPDGLPTTRAKFVGQDPQGTLWAAGNDWLAFPRHDRAIFMAARGDPPDTIYAATADRRGNYWIACRNGLLRARQPRENEDGAGIGMLFERALPHSVTGPGGVRSVFEDREGSIWVGTNGRGLLRLRKALFTSTSLPPDIRYKSAGFLTADTGGGLWVWFGNQIRRLNNDEWATVPQLAQMKPFDSISTGPSETLWFAHDGRWLSKLVDGQFTRYEHSLGHIDSILESSQGLVFLGSSNTLSVFREGRITTMTVDDGLPPAGVVSLLTESKDGTIWAARDEAVTGYRDGEFVHYTTADGLPPARIRSMHVDDEGNLWIATYGMGLARLRDGELTRYTTRDGLPDNSLGKILEDDDGNLWINSLRGVFHVVLKELNAFAAGRISMINCRSLRTGEGNNAGGVRT
ncbi:MAG: hypothetical protein IH988_09950, partial [Planctomycetes bacterium]|nr:hypothetical protein [Planctomycetota bacterium]